MNLKVAILLQVREVSKFSSEIISPEFVRDLSSVLPEDAESWSQY
jgi:hypothetical protein